MIGIGTIVLFVNSILNNSVDYYAQLNNILNIQINKSFFNNLYCISSLIIFIIKNLFVFFVKIFEHFVTYQIKINKKIFKLYAHIFSRA